MRSKIKLYSHLKPRIKGTHSARGNSLLRARGHPLCRDRLSSILKGISSTQSFTHSAGHFHSMLSGLPSCKDRLLWQEKDLHLDKDKASCTAREVLLLRGLILWGKRMQLSSLCELSYDATLICLHNCLLKLNVSE